MHESGTKYHVAGYARTQLFGLSVAGALSWPDDISWTVFAPIIGILIAFASYCRWSNFKKFD